MHVTNIPLQRKIYTHEYTRFVPSGGSEAFKKPLEDEATTKDVKRSPGSRPPGLREKIEYTLASCRTAISN